MTHGLRHIFFPILATQLGDNSTLGCNVTYGKEQNRKCTEKNLQKERTLQDTKDAMEYKHKSKTHHIEGCLSAQSFITEVISSSSRNLPTLFQNLHKFTKLSHYLFLVFSKIQTNKSDFWAYFISFYMFSFTCMTDVNCVEM